MRSSPIDLAGTKLVLTGATRGVGRALSRLLIEKGATVAAIARDQDKLATLRDELGDRLVPFPCDLSEPDARGAVIVALKHQFSSLDGLINNAGIQTEMSHIGGDACAVARQAASEIETNLTAPVHLITGLMPHMATRPAPVVVNITSGLAIAPKEAAPVYSATKAGLRSFTIALRYQAQSTLPTLRVIEVVLPLVDTDMTRGRGRGKLTPDEAAEKILNGVQRRKTEIWVGKAKLIPVLTRLSPQIPARILR